MGALNWLSQRVHAGLSRWRRNVAILPQGQSQPTNGGQINFKYWAFISYSHQDEQHGRWGSRLHKALETYRVPKKLVGRDAAGVKVPQRIRPIFLDREELASASSLPDTIRHALEQSRCLVVICSPYAAASRWVNEEIRTFKALGRENQVLSLIVDGEPYATDDPNSGKPECFPAALRFQLGPDGHLTREEAEPLAADARADEQTNIRLRSLAIILGVDKRWNDAKLRLLAGILGVDYDELKQREKQRQQRRRVWIAAAALTMLAIVASIWLLGRLETERQHRLALSRELAAQSIDQVPVNHELALLLAIEAGRQENTLEADTALRTSLNQSSRALSILFGHKDAINDVEWDQTGSRIVTASSDGTARVWDAQSGAALVTLAGHKGPVWLAAWDPTGKRIVTASDDGTARIWDAASGAELAVLTAPRFLLPPESIGYAAWDPAGTRIATASDDGTPRIWDAKTGKELVALNGHTSIVSQVAWSPDGSLLATASEDSTARVWDTENGKELVTLQGHIFGGKAFPVRIVAWSPDGKRLLTVGTDGSAVVWDSKTWKSQITLAGPSRFGAMHFPIRDAAWDGDGKRVVFANAAFGQENGAEIWDADSGIQLAVLRGHTNWVVHVAWNKDGTRILTASWDGTARVWDAQSGKELITLAGNTGDIRYATWSPDGTRVATASADHTARVWNPEGASALPVITFDVLQELAGEIAWDPTGARVVIANGHGAAAVFDAATGIELARLSDQTDNSSWRSFAARGDLQHPVWSPDGARILTAGSDGAARIWDAQNGRELIAFSKYTNTLSVALWDPDGHRIATGDVNSNIHVWDVDRHAELTSITSTQSFGILHMAWSPDGTLIAVVRSDGTAQVWNATTGDETTSLVGHTSNVTYLSWSPNALRLATSSFDSTARVWDAQSGQQLLVLSGHMGAVLSVEWSPDGSRLVTAGSDRTARIWDARRGTELAVLSGHTDSVGHAAWSPDGMRIVTASSDNTARVWDAATGAELSVLSGHGEGWHFTAVVHAIWDPTGTRIVTTGYDGVARVHYVLMKDMLEAACRLAVRNMSEAEWKQYMHSDSYQRTCPGKPVPGQDY